MKYICFFLFLVNSLGTHAELLFEDFTVLGDNFDEDALFFSNIVDMDNDGDLDITVSGSLKNSNTNEIGWIENIATNQYSYHAIRPMGGNTSHHPHQPIDIDNDSDIDIIEHAAIYRKIYIHNNDGEQSFTRQAINSNTPLYLGNQRPVLLIDDFNNDGDKDIIVVPTNETHPDVSKISVWKNSDLTFTTSFIPTAYLNFVFAKAVDFNKDGLLDIIVSHQNRTVSLFTNQGSMTFLESELFQTPNQFTQVDITVTDFDLDGTSEILLAGYHVNTTEGKVYLYDFDSQGNVVESTLIAGLNKPNKMVISDIYIDGKPEVILSSLDTESIQLVKFNQDLTYEVQTQQHSGINGKDIKLVDIDKDGDRDIILASEGNLDIVGLKLVSNLSNSFLQYQQHMQQQTGIYPNRSMVYDMNNDGLIDVVEVKRTTTNNTGGEIRIHFQVSDGSYVESVNKSSVPLGEVVQMGIADINSDGLADVITTSINRNEVVVHYANYQNSTFDSVVVDNTIMSTYALAIADMDMDGDLDIVVSSFGNGEVILLDQDDGSFTQRLVASIPSVTTLDVDDISMDGVPDIVVYDFFNNDLQWIEMLPGTDTIHDIDDIWLLNGNAGDVQLVDYDRDGDLDLAVGGYIGAFWMNFDRVTGEFTSPTQPYVITNVGYVTDIDLKDIDNDGDVDWLASTRGTTQDPGGAWAIKTIDRNDTDIATGYKKFKITDHESVYSVSGTDMDHDGDVDVTVAFDNGENTGVAVHSLIGDTIFADGFNFE
ncbi:MAG: VCBS repeat-containing protein [Marinicella sp.]